jgi:hypothetical protein
MSSGLTKNDYPSGLLTLNEDSVATQTRIELGHGAVKAQLLYRNAREELDEGRDI